VDPKPPYPSQAIPHGGLANADHSPKQAIKSWSSLRRAVTNFRQTPPAKPGPPADPMTPSA
jgi:hypothetical protein